jgi:hypothetical protein
MAGGGGRSFAAAGSNPLPDQASPERDSLVTRLTGGSRILWWWAGLVLVVLLVQDPMFRNHLAALVAPLALIAARYRPSWRLVAITVLVTAPIQIVQLRPLLLPEDYKGDAATVVDALRALPGGAWALSDEPGFIWRAGKATDPFFVDPSVLRIDSNVKEIKITQANLLDAAANPRQCAVVVWAPVRFGRFKGLPEGLVKLGYEQTEDFGHGRGMWVRPDCDPAGRSAAGRTEAAPSLAPGGPAMPAAGSARSPH